MDIELERKTAIGDWSKNFLDPATVFWAGIWAVLIELVKRVRIRTIAEWLSLLRIFTMPLIQIGFSVWAIFCNNVSNVRGLVGYVQRQTIRIDITMGEVSSPLTLLDDRARNYLRKGLTLPSWKEGNPVYSP